MTAPKQFLPISVLCLLISGTSSAWAGSGSSLDPYALIQAPTAKELEEKTNKARAKKGLPPLPKKTTTAESPLSEPSGSTTYVTAPGGGVGKKVKEQAQVPVKSTTKVVAESTPTKDAAGTDSGVMDGIKTIGAGYTKTFKAATHGAVSATKASCGVMINGSKKVGGGIVGGAKATGGAMAKGASIVGHGFMSTGEKIKENSGGIGEKMASIPGMIGHGFKATGEKMKEGSEKIAGAIPNPFHKDKAPAKETQIATKPKSTVAAPKAEPKAQQEDLKDDLQDEMIDDAKPIAVAPQKEKAEPAAEKTVAHKGSGLKAKFASLPKIKLKNPFSKDQPAKEVAGKSPASKPVM